MTAPLPPALTVDESTKFTGVSRVCTYQAIKDGTFPFAHFRIGRRIMIPTRPLLDALGIDHPIQTPGTGGAAA